MNFKLPTEYEVLVVGSGHAGIEAALAAARVGCRTLMLTQNLDTIGQMSCNPAIGGLAKGHIVREIDAMGGAMGLNADATGIQFRMLNRRKGPSVRAPRAQCDKKAYQFRMKAILESAENLDLKQGTASRGWQGRWRGNRFGFENRYAKRRDHFGDIFARSPPRRRSQQGRRTNGRRQFDSER